MGQGRRLPRVDTTPVEVSLETGTSECSGVVNKDDGRRSRGDPWATLRTVVDHAGLRTQVRLGPLHVHDVPACRLVFEPAPVLRPGEVFLDDRGVLDGATITLRTHQRHVEVMVPWQSTLVSETEAVHLAELHEAWPPHPSRDHQHIAFVTGVDHLWAECRVPLNAGVRRSWHRTKAAVDPLVLVTTAQGLSGPWIVRHDEERPEIDHDDAPRKSGGWQLTKLRATRDSAIVLSLATVVLSYRLYPLCANTQAGARCANTTRQARACEQRWTHRPHVMVYAGGYCAMCETLTFVHWVLGLPLPVQARLRLWLDEHLKHIEKLE